MVNFNKKKAFTLAELLIAMFLFAFIAVTLIPNVTSNAEKSLFITQTKKVQNDIQQALLLMMSENQGTLQMYCSGAEDNYSKCFRDAISKKINIFTTFGTDLSKEEKKKCTDKTKLIANSCKQQVLYKRKNPTFLNKQSTNFSINDDDSFYAANLASGATMSIEFDPECTTVQGTCSAKLYEYGLSSTTKACVETNPVRLCGYVEVDVNAAKAPNVVGKDIHYFWIIDKDGLVPFGELDNLTCGNIDSNDKITTKPANNRNTADTLTQLGCTYRLLRKGRIDYY